MGGGGVLPRPHLNADGQHYRLRAPPSRPPRGRANDGDGVPGRVCLHVQLHVRLRRRHDGVGRLARERGHPAGVGFLGAASIWKGTQPKDGAHGEVHAPEVHGLTTATSVWFSAAVGLLCGGGLYVPAFFATALSVVYLRFAPRLDRETQAEDELDEYKELDVELDAQLRGMPASRNSSSGTISSFLRHDQRNPSMDRMSSMSSISSFFGARCNPLSLTEPLNPSGTAYRVDSDRDHSETSRKPRSPPRRPSLNL